MAKKQSIVSEIGSALGAVAARAEKLVTKPAKKTTTAAAPPVAAPAPAASAKPTAKRTVAAKHSKAPSTPVVNPVVTPSVAPVAAPVVAPVAISHDAIAKLAYSYWEARGYQPGNPAEDWTRAEAELRRAL